MDTQQLLCIQFHYMKNAFLTELVEAIQKVIAKPEYAADPDKVKFGNALITVTSGYVGVPTPPGP